MLLVNPKNGETIETDLPEEEIKVLLAKAARKNEFASSLYSRWGRFSPSQSFWAYKLALQERVLDPILLESNLEKFTRKFPTLTVNMKEGNFSEELASIGKLYISEAIVYANRVKVGEIKENYFYPTSTCSKIIIAQIKLFAKNPIEFLEFFGKATGRCMICSRMLTNEGSVKRGIGPICADNYGI